MIVKIYTFEQTSLFDVPADALVNPCNCKGIAGAGLSLEFKCRYPEAHKLYVENCKLGRVTIGKVLVVHSRGTNIVYFPTKEHWRNPSQLDYIKQGLESLKAYNRLESISIPQLGCGLGGLNWAEVKPLILEAMKNFDGVVNLFE